MDKNNSVNQSQKHSSGERIESLVSQEQGLVSNAANHDPERFCEKIDEWAALMMGNDRIGDAASFGRAWREVRLAISKSCLLSRTIYKREKPSQTPCPVHKGKWSGLHLGWPDQHWNDGTPINEDPARRADYNAGCRCFQHTCGCTTGWQPDAACGCATGPAPERDAETQ